MKLGDVMDEIADAVRSVPSLQGRSYAYPQQAIQPPAAIIPFPSATFDMTYQRGSDQVEISVVVLVPGFDMRAARDSLLAYMDGSGDESIKAAVEGHTYTALDSLRVETVEIREYFVSDSAYLAAVFTIDVIGSGTTS